MISATPFSEYRPMLICRDVPRALEFYTRVLGFQVVDRDDSIGRSGFASLRNGPVSLMLASPHPETRATKVAGRYPQMVHYFYCHDVVALRDTVLEAGFEAGDLHVTFYRMREFDLIDPEGHYLVFGQDVGESQDVGCQR